jgi:ADP-ribose pyrophosphatase
MEDCRVIGFIFSRPGMRTFAPVDTMNKEFERKSMRSGNKTTAKGTSGKSTGSRAEANTASMKTKGKPGAKVDLVSSKLAYRGPLFEVYTDHVREPEGIVSRRDVVRHPGSVVILAIESRGNERDPLVVIERQYRHAAARYMWEIPAGRIEPKESTLAGAKRELLEETGYRAARWTKMARFYASPGFLAEWMQIYLAEDLSSGESKPDEDEYIEHCQIPLSQALEWVHSGKIVDGKSIIAILQYQREHSATSR